MGKRLFSLAIIFFVSLLASGYSLDCNIGGVPVACPFDFLVGFHAVCAPANLNNSVRVDVSAPAGWGLEDNGTFLAGGGTIYSEFYRDANTLYFPVPKMTKNQFMTKLTINGVSGNSSSPLNVTACPCVLDRKGFFVSYDEATGRQVLQGSVSGSSGCKTDGSVIYKTVFFIRQTGMTEVVSGTSTGDFLEISSGVSYSPDDPLTFQVAVVDAGSGLVYGFFSPERFKANDFSVKATASQPLRLISGVQGQVSFNLTNLGTLTEPFTLSFLSLPSGWQSSSITTKPLPPGESLIVPMGVFAQTNANLTNTTLQVISQGSAKTKTIPVSFVVGKNIGASAELYSSAEKVAAGTTFDLTILIKASAYVPEEKIYWTVFSNPQTKFGSILSGSFPVAGTTSRSVSTYVEKMGCEGPSSYRKVSTVLRAIVENPGKTDALSAALTTISTGTPLASEVISFVNSKNKTTNSAQLLLAKIDAAENRSLSNCTLSEGTANLAVFAIDTLNGVFSESGAVPISLSGKEGSITLLAAESNVSVSKGASATAKFILKSALPSDRTVSLRASHTSFKIEFPNGSSVKIPAYGTIEIPVLISDKGTIIKPVAEPLQIDATTTDATGEPISSSATSYISIRVAALELITAFPATMRLEQGGSKAVEVKVRNSGNGRATFSFSVNNPSIVSPTSLDLDVGEIGTLNLTVNLDTNVVEGSKVAVTLIGKMLGTGEESTWKMDVTAASSTKTKIKTQLDGLEDAMNILAQDCKYYSLSKLKTLLTSARDKFSKGDFNGAGSYYDLARAEYTIAETKCAKPDSAATLMIIAGIVAVVGAIYYFAVYKKKPKTGFKPQYPTQQQLPPRRY